MIGSDKEVTRLGLEEIFLRLYGTSPELSFPRDIFETNRRKRIKRRSLLDQQSVSLKVSQINSGVLGFSDLWRIEKAT